MPALLAHHHPKACYLCTLQAQRRQQASLVAGLGITQTCVPSRPALWQPLVVMFWGAYPTVFAWYLLSPDAMRTTPQPCACDVPATARARSLSCLSVTERVMGRRRPVMACTHGASAWPAAFTCQVCCSLPIGTARVLHASRMPNVALVCEFSTTLVNACHRCQRVPVASREGPGSAPALYSAAVQAMCQRAAVFVACRLPNPDAVQCCARTGFAPVVTLSTAC